MNITEFREKYPQYKDIEDQVLATKFHDKYYADIPTKQFNAKFLGTQPAQKIDHSVPTVWQRAKPYVEAGAKATMGALTQPMSRSGLEMGGMMAGEVLGGVPGGGLGYAAGRQAADLLEHAQGSKEPYNLKGQAIKAGIDVPLGMAMGGVGKVAYKVISPALEKVAAMAPRIYERMLKLPINMSRGARNEITETMLKEKIPISEYGLEKSQSTANSISKEVDGIITAASKKGKTISRDAALKSLEKVKTKYENTDLPKSHIKVINKYIDDLKAEHGAKIPIRQAQEIKKSIYKELKSEYKAASKGMPRNLSDELVAGKKGFAHGLMQEITEQFPILKNLNPRDGSLLNAEEYLTKAVNRVHNHEIGGLALDIGAPIVGGAVGGYEGRRGGAGGIGGGIAGGAALGMGISRALKNPAFMSRLAFALNKASKLVGSPAVSTAARSLGYSAGKATPAVADALTSSAHAEELPALAKSVFSATNNPNDIYKGGYSDINSPQRPINIKNKVRAENNLSASLADKGMVKKTEKPVYENEVEAVPGMNNEQKATDAYLNGDYTKAIDHFRMAIKESPVMASRYKQAINTILKEQKAIKEKGYKVAKETE